MGSRFAALTLAATLLTGGSAVAQCSDDEVSLRGDFGEVRFTVDLARTPQERAQGLMFVESMPASRGMLFIYEMPKPVAFWMKNTLIPLDIIYADATGTVLNVQANAIPGDLTGLPSAGAAQYVLEINGGMSAMLKIGPGTQMRHPSIAQAAWPCEPAE